jgi:lipopolysaccharide export system protein LptC
MNFKLTPVIILFAIASLSIWYMNRLSLPVTEVTSFKPVVPDYYLENFTTTSMNADGSPRNRVNAIYMAHYANDDASELLNPSMQFFRTNRPPMHISSDKGWLTSDNEVILLKGLVELFELDETGARKLQVNTSNTRVLPNRDYAETDAPATIITGRLTIQGDGMRAHLQENRLEILSNVHTTILPK